MKVKDLIKKLWKVDPELDVIIEPNIDYTDTDIYSAYHVFRGKVPPITLRYAQAESNRENSTDSWDEDYIEFGYDYYHQPIDKKRVLVISSPEFKYGVREKEESPEFKVPMIMKCSICSDKERKMDIKLGKYRKSRLTKAERDEINWKKS